LIALAACGSFSEAAAPDDGGTTGDGAPTQDAPAGDVIKMGDAAPDAGGMIEVAGFTIDATEVTNAAYNVFLAAATAPDAGAVKQHEYCGWNDSFARGCTSNLAEGSPVACVDWCDAWAYCTWAGKRLCGKIGGGALEPTEAADPTKSQWTRACGGIEPQLYPYGPTALPAVCTTNEISDGGPSKAGSRSTCQGRPLGLFDMSGNVGEWEDSCDLSGARDVNLCFHRGGSFSSGASDSKCTNVAQRQRKSVAETIGFRCCAP